MFQIGQKKCLWLQTFKILWTYVVSHLNDKENVGTFYEENCKRQIKRV